MSIRTLSNVFIQFRTCPVNPGVVVSAPCHDPGFGHSALSAFLCNLLYAAGLSYLKQTDGNFAYLDPARFLPSSLEGCVDHACDAGR